MATIDNYKINMSVVGEQAVVSATNALKTFGGVIAGITTLQFAQSVLTLADDMADLADSVGLTMAAVTGFSLAVQQAGGTFEDAGKGIVKFYKALGEGGEDQSSKAAESLRKVGIGLDDIKTKSEGQLLAQALQQLAEMEAGAERTTATLALFGKSFAGIDPGALLEVLKTTDAEGFAQGLLKVKDANDKMSAAMFQFKVAAADALGPLMPLLNGVLSVIGVVAKHLDVLAIAMGAVFGAAMLANIGKITTAMRLFAASNPFTLIAVAVGTLVVAVSELIDTYGSFGNAMRAVGNMGINLINTLVNAYKSYGLFMGSLFEGIGKAILAGLNPFSNKTAMGELQAGLQKGLAAVQKQMAAKGPISFKFDVQPVVKKKGKSALDELLGDQGVVNADATGLTEQQAENRQKEALAAQQVTQQLALQNQQANKLRQLSIDTIGMETNRANLIKSNAQAEADGINKVADLEAKIVAERAKGKNANAAVIVELQKQIGIVNQQTNAVKELNEQEFLRLEYQKSITRQLDNIQQRINRNTKKEIADKEEAINKQRVLGQLTSDQAAEQLAQESRKIEYENKRKLVKAELEGLERRSTQSDNEAIRTLEDKLRNLDLEYNQNEKIIAQKLAGEEAIRQSMNAGAADAIANIAKQFEPYKMAQDAIMMGWNKIGSAVDDFVETGKFKFSDFARSVIADLSKMIIKALLFKAIESTLGAFGLKLPGMRANGGPVGANEPYIVGEKGPELFVPKNAGTVIPNNKLAASAQATGTGMVNAPINNTYITNNISALDAKSVAQLFVENRKTMLGTIQMAQREMPYAV